MWSRRSLQPCRGEPSVAIPREAGDSESDISALLHAGVTLAAPAP
ncbi:MAG: hypothetical protein AB7N91_04900 [Candidatus Tectimicrobiota bacterium]